MNKSLTASASSFCVLLLMLGAQEAAFAQSPSSEDICFRAPGYVVYRTTDAIEVDGRLDESVWARVPWTSHFVEMAEGTRPPASIGTRAKMVWDDDALYVAARLEEPDVWATMTERDTRIYLDNAFEVFVDPDGDTQNYYELEVNALGTIWDLMLIKPYRDGGPALSAWDIRGIGVGTHVDGTLNDPSDTDEGWSVEFALPWSVLAEAAPEGRAPVDGERWRFNFSRSHWELDVVDGSYRKKPDTPADWSVWSPQGVIDIHRPECWGAAQFSDNKAGAGEVTFVDDPNDRVKAALRRLYYRQLEYRDRHGRFADDLHDLGAEILQVEGVDVDPQLRTTQTTYEITSPGADGTVVHIQHDGKVWTTLE